MAVAFCSSWICITSYAFFGVSLTSGSVWQQISDPYLALVLQDGLLAAIDGSVCTLRLMESSGSEGTDLEASALLLSRASQEKGAYTWRSFLISQNPLLKP